MCLALPANDGGSGAGLTRVLSLRHFLAIAPGRTTAIMRRVIGIVVSPGFQLPDAAGPIAVFEMAERFRPESYAWSVLTPSKTEIGVHCFQCDVLSEAYRGGLGCRGSKQRRKQQARTDA